MDIFCGLLMFVFIGFIIAIIVTIFGYILAIITYLILMNICLQRRSIQLLIR